MLFDEQNLSPQNLNSVDSVLNVQRTEPTPHHLPPQPTISSPIQRPSAATPGRAAHAGPGREAPRARQLRACRWPRWSQHRRPQRQGRLRLRRRAPAREYLWKREHGAVVSTCMLSMWPANARAPMVGVSWTATVRSTASVQSIQSKASTASSTRDKAASTSTERPGAPLSSAGTPTDQAVRQIGSSTDTSE